MTSASTSEPRAPQIDVVILVSNMHRLQYLFRPVHKMYRLLAKLQRWDSKTLSGVVLLCWNFIVAFLPIEMSLLVSLSLILLLAVLGHLYTKSGVPANWSWTEILTKPGEKVDNLVIRRQFYALLVQVNQLLEDSLAVLFKVHQALSWGDTLLAAQCYSVLVVLTMLFHLFPLRWCLLLLGNAFLAQRFIFHLFGKLYRRLSLRRRALVRSASLDDFVDLRENSHLLLTASKKELLSRSLQDLRRSSDSDQFTDKYSTRPESASTKNSPVKEHHLGAFNKNTYQSHSHDSLLVSTTVSAGNSVTVRDAQTTPASVQTSAGEEGWRGAAPGDAVEDSHDSTVYDENTPATSSNMFGRFKEFRRRMLEVPKTGGGTNTGKELTPIDKVPDKCLACEEKFTSILKRRRVCAHCGNHFCNNCCSKRLPKSFFGATSPTAQTDLVLVCNYCHLYLVQNKKAT